MFRGRITRSACQNHLRDVIHIIVHVSAFHISLHPRRSLRPLLDGYRSSSSSDGDDNSSDSDSTRDTNSSESSSSESDNDLSDPHDNDSSDDLDDDAAQESAAENDVSDSQSNVRSSEEFEADESHDEDNISDGYESADWNPGAGTRLSLDHLRRNQIVEFWYRRSWWPGSIRYLNYRTGRCNIQVLLSQSTVKNIQPKHVRWCRFDAQ